MSGIHLKILALLVAAAAAILALLVPTAGTSAGAAPVAARPTDDPPPLDQIRQGTVDRANSALSHKHHWKDAGGTMHLSSLHLSASPPYNYLGANGSNTNKNVYDNYNGDPWCGYFAAAIWTGVMTPDPSHFPRIPDSYASSQQWATGSSFHNYSASHLPTAGDVLVWQNDAPDTAHGHVGVVVSVNYDNNWVTTIEGNQATADNSDSIVKKKYQWTHTGGPSLPGKHFLGYRSRD